MPTKNELNEARDHLVKVLEFALEHLGDLFVGKVELKDRPPMSKPFRDRFQQAWAEFRDNFDLGAARRRIYELEDAYLVSAGLFGAQLRLKWDVVREAAGRFWRELNHVSLTPFLDALDAVLESMKVDHGLIELKEIFGAAAEMRA